AARLRAPGRSVVMQDGPTVPDGEDIRGAAPPDTMQRVSDRARIPNGPVVMKDRRPPHDEDVRGPAPPDTGEAVDVLRRSAGLRGPFHSVVVKNVLPVNRKHAVGGASPHPDEPGLNGLGEPTQYRVFLRDVSIDQHLKHEAPHRPWYAPLPGPQFRFLSWLQNLIVPEVRLVRPCKHANAVGVLNRYSPGSRCHRGA